MTFYSRKARPTFLAGLFSAAILCVLAFFLPSGYGGYAPPQTCVQPPAGAIAWWPLDETSGTVAKDIAGNNPGIHVNGPVPVAGNVGGALGFNGSDQYVGAPDSDLWAFGSRDFSIELWANFASPGGGTIGHPSHIFIGNDEGPGTQNKWFFALGGGFLNFHINGPVVGSHFFPLAPFTPTLNQWYHLAVTRSANVWTIYVNGATVGLEIRTVEVPNANAPLTIGQAEELGFMNGPLDEVTIYDRALTHEELQAIFDAGSAGKCKALSIVTKNLAAVQLGEATSQTLQSAFGTPPVSWSLSDGILPLGMSLSTDGVIAGTPLEAGTFVLTIRATDAEGTTAERTFVLTVFLNLPPPEIRVQIAGTVPVPGRAVDYFIAVENVGTTSASNVNIHALVVPNQFTFLSADPALAVDDPNTVLDPNTVRWLLPELAPGEVRVLTYKARLKTTVPIGSVVTPAVFVNPDVSKALICFWETIRTAGICTACSVECGVALSCLFFPKPGCLLVFIPACLLCLHECPESLDILIENCYSKNSPTGDSKPQVVRGAVDPNEKVATTARFTRPDRVLTYPIHFENVGDIEARDVFVTDVLDPNLDPSTMSLLTPTGGSFDVATRTVKWDLLNRSLEPGETGNVLLSIRPRPGLPSGTIIRNSATIQFEVFQPFVTNEVVNVIDSIRPTSVMNPLPAETSTLDFPISWSGSDAIGEIDFYSILASVDGGNFTPFLERTRETSAVFRGELGKTYGFLSVATDTAGNIEVQNAVAEAITQIIVTGADIAITKVVAPNPVLTGENITYTITVANNGPGAAADVVVTDILPASTAFVSCSSTGGGVCGGSGNNRTVTFASLASGASATITLVASVNCSVADNTVISNTSLVSSSTPDPTTDNNSATVTKTASNPPPSITCPANIGRPTDPGACSAVVSYTTPTATDNCAGGTVVCSPASGSVFPRGTTTVTCTATDSGARTTACSFAVTVNPRQLSALSTANVWIGLRNSDDVGTDFDLFVEVFKNSTLAGSGQLNSVRGGSSGFNNAVQRTINLALPSSQDLCPGDTLSIRLSVRIAASSRHRSGTARLWFNDTAANSRLGATLGGAANTYFFLDGSVLGTSAGPGPKRTVDVPVDRAVGGNPFKPFGTWVMNP